MDPTLEYLLYLLLGIVISVIIGAIFVWAVYYIYDYFLFKKIKKNVPLKDKLVNPGVQTIEEVNEDESLNKNRELEKFTKMVDGKNLLGDTLKWKHLIYYYLAL